MLVAERLYMSNNFIFFLDGRGIINEVLSSPVRRSNNVLCCLCLGMFLGLSFFPRPGNIETTLSSSNRVGRTLLQVYMPTPTHNISWVSLFVCHANTVQLLCLLCQYLVVVVESCNRSRQLVFVLLVLLYPANWHDFFLLKLAKNLFFSFYIFILYKVVFVYYVCLFFHKLLKPLWLNVIRNYCIWFFDPFLNDPFTPQLLKVIFCDLHTKY